MAACNSSGGLPSASGESFVLPADGHRDADAGQCSYIIKPPNCYEVNDREINFEERGEPVDVRGSLEPVASGARELAHLEDVETIITGLFTKLRKSDMLTRSEGTIEFSSS